MQNEIYNLTPQHGSDFYGKLSVFTDQILTQAQDLYPQHIDPYLRYMLQNGRKLRHRDEYLVEFIMLGMLSERYWTYVRQSSELSIGIHSYLYGLRKRHPRLKARIDRLRGYTSARWMYTAHPSAGTMTRHSLNKLVRWLHATGEFKEESQRLNEWAKWLGQLSDGQASAHLMAAQDFASSFARQADCTLGIFTQGVDLFLQSHAETYSGREDFLFCGRKPSEYHLNMFGAEILNRVLRPAFDVTTERVLIVPTCMCEPRAECRSVNAGLHKICTGCTSRCGVNALQRSMQLQGIAVRLIPHSSGFSKFLEHWQHQQKTGLIGVACVLNLLSGGYEMQRLGIPSQCVFLENSGCKKHWHPQGIPTRINEQQLTKVACCRKCSVA